MLRLFSWDDLGGGGNIYLGELTGQFTVLLALVAKKIQKGGPSTTNLCVPRRTRCAHQRLHRFTASGFKQIRSTKRRRFLADGEASQGLGHELSTWWRW